MILLLPGMYIHSCSAQYACLFKIEHISSALRLAFISGKMNISRFGKDCEAAELNSEEDRNSAFFKNEKIICSQASIAIKDIPPFNKSQ